MGYSDLDEARRHHQALKAIVLRHAGEEADLRALRRVVDLCRAASAAVDDAYCRDKIRLVAEYGAEILSAGGHHKWDRGTMSGLEFLRQQVLNALELYQSRLYSLEAIRRAAERSYGRGVGGSLAGSGRL